VVIERTAGRIAAAALLAGLGACTVGPDFQKPEAWWQPASWFAGKPAEPPRPTASAPVAEPIDAHWWNLFHDATLTGLEERLIGANLDLRIASVRLAEARAELGVAAAARLPHADINGSYTRIQQSKLGALALTSSTPETAAQISNGLGNRTSTPNSPSSNNKLFEPYDLFQDGFDVSWEVDLWGHVAREVETAAAQATASEEARRDTMVTASAELARDYVMLRGVQRKLAITRENLDTARQSLQLTRDRAAGGVTTDLDVANAAAQVATVEAALPPFEAQQASLVNALSLLLGSQPGALQVELAAARPIPPVPPRVPVGVPAELARRRPDIRQAEANLHAATAEIGVATAEFFPTVTLAGSGAIQGLQFRQLTDLPAQTYSFGPSVTLPIFQGGRLTRTLELRKAQQQEAALAYQRTVLGALHEVDNALTAYGTEQRRRDLLEEAVTQNQRALALARERYEQGVTDFLQVLTAERALLAAQQDLTDSTTTVSTDLVQLYKALGGGWDEDAPAKS
jgi:NodT family efflux transporter outer membrane factor (OMF) lipoprotein